MIRLYTIFCLVFMYIIYMFIYTYMCVCAYIVLDYMHLLSIHTYNHRYSEIFLVHVHHYSPLLRFIEDIDGKRNHLFNF